MKIYWDGKMPYGKILKPAGKTCFNYFNYV